MWLALYHQIATPISYNLWFTLITPLSNEIWDDSVLFSVLYHRLNDHKVYLIQ